MLSTLVLVPTPWELECLTNSFHQHLLAARSTIQLCGFGPIVSGIMSARLIAEHSPDRVFLIGIAGTYDPDISLASFVEFDEVACYGIGAGTGNQFMSSSELKWEQWPSDHKKNGIGDVISLRKPTERSSTMQLLTCCSAASCLEDVQLRTKKFPRARAEDMEGFSVASACMLSNVPLRIFRGISNFAGDRNHAHWEIREAMAAVETAVSRILH
ncbi:MAG: hypothetical protein ABL921_33025 [Pirellula sp.]